MSQDFVTLAEKRFEKVRETMKKLLAIIVAGAMSAMAVSTVADETTFELKYRGLTAPDDPLSYRSFWGFGQSRQADSPFIAAVKQHVEKYDLVYNAMLPEKARWALVELKDNKPVAFYFDADANGEFSDNEKFGPATPQGDNFGYECAFITSDFMTRSQDGKEAPFRTMLVGYRSGPENISYMWSPCCILEGEATLAGKPTRMIMYANGFQGSFSTFRQCSVALSPADEKTEGSPSRQSLSSLIYYKDTFYRLKLDGTHAKGETLSVTLEKDATPTGEIEVDLIGSETLKARLTRATIEGTEDNTIYFSVGSSRTTFPAGAYRLASGAVTYGTRNDEEWRVNFNEGPAFDITDDDTSTIKLGQLSLEVRAVKENERYRADVKPTSTFAKGTALYVEPKIVGKAGEAYVQFTQQGSQPNRYEAVKPHLRIVGPDGEEIASTDLEYG